MKLYEIQTFNFSNVKDVERWLDNYRLSRACKVKSNCVVDAKTDQGQKWMISFGTAGNDLKLDAKLPFKFGKVGYFSVAGHKKLNTFENFPDEAEEIHIDETGIASLVGIEKVVKRMKYPGVISISARRITQGGIGLILIPGLQTIQFGPASNPKVHQEPWKIIEKYLGRPDDIFECQAELIEKGFEEFAKL